MEWPRPRDWALAFRDTSNVNNERTAIFAIVPRMAAGNKLPLLTTHSGPEVSVLLCANANSFAFDYAVRHKMQSRNLNLYILEQIPVVAPREYARSFRAGAASQIIADHVLRLTYTAHDMTPFARDMGYEGAPFRWDEDERRHLRARLDALYFHLYGITDEVDIRYILSTFPIVERKDREAYNGVYLTAELILWYFRALAAGDPISLAPEDEILRGARRAA